MLSTGIYSSKKRILGAFLYMMLGGMFVVLLIVALNESVDKKQDAVKQQTRIVKVEKTEKKVVKKEKPKPKKNVRRTKDTSKAPPPDLSSIIGGIEMNIPEFEAAAVMEGDARDLLDDIAEETVMSEGTVDSKPQVAHRADIEYPADAAQEGIEGYVVVHLLVSKDGSVELAKVLEAEPQGVFEKNVLDGVRDWRFMPARYKGNPVQVWVKQKIRFNT